MSRPSAEPVLPLLAATILIIRDDPLEVLMVQRRKSSFFSSALVFPGGIVDEQDASEVWLPYFTGSERMSVRDRALRVAGCREAFEEAGVLLAASADQDGGSLVCESFYEYVRALKARIPLESFQPFAHWITPLRAVRRFDTHFFLCKAPPGLEPKSDGEETVTAEWMRPVDAIALAATGERSIVLPTLMNLRKLAESTDADSAIAAARDRPIVTVTPRVERRESGTVLIIPEEAGYGLTEFPAPVMASGPEASELEP